MGSLEGVGGIGIYKGVSGISILGGGREGGVFGVLGGIFWSWGGSLRFWG